MKLVYYKSGDRVTAQIFQLCWELVHTMHRHLSPRWNELSIIAVRHKLRVIWAELIEDK